MADDEKALERKATRGVAVRVASGLNLFRSSRNVAFGSSSSSATTTRIRTSVTTTTPTKKLYHPPPFVRFLSQDRWDDIRQILQQKKQQEEQLNDDDDHDDDRKNHETPPRGDIPHYPYRTLSKEEKIAWLEDATDFMGQGALHLVLKRNPPRDVVDMVVEYRSYSTRNDKSKNGRARKASSSSSLSPPRYRYYQSHHSSSSRSVGGGSGSGSVATGISGSSGGNKTRRIMSALTDECSMRWTALHIAVGWGAGSTVVARILQQASSRSNKLTLLRMRDVEGRLPLHMLCLNPYGSTVDDNGSNNHNTKVKSSNRQRQKTNSRSSVNSVLNLFRGKTPQRSAVAHDRRRPNDSSLRSPLEPLGIPPEDDDTAHDMVEVARLLVDLYPSAVNVTDKHGKTPLEYAMESQASSELLKLLEQTAAMAATGTSKKGGIILNTKLIKEDARQSKEKNKKISQQQQLQKGLQELDEQPTHRSNRNQQQQQHLSYFSYSGHTRPTLSITDTPWSGSGGRHSGSSGRKRLFNSSAHNQFSASLSSNDNAIKSPSLASPGLQRPIWSDLTEVTGVMQPPSSFPSISAAPPPPPPGAPTTGEPSQLPLLSSATPTAATTQQQHMHLFPTRALLPALPLPSATEDLVKPASVMPTNTTTTTTTTHSQSGDGGGAIATVTDITSSSAADGPLTLANGTTTTIPSGGTTLQQQQQQQELTTEEEPAHEQKSDRNNDSLEPFPQQHGDDDGNDLSVIINMPLALRLEGDFDCRPDDDADYSKGRAVLSQSARATKKRSGSPPPGMPREITIDGIINSGTVLEDGTSAVDGSLVVNNHKDDNNDVDDEDRSVISDLTIPKLRTSRVICAPTSNATTAAAVATTVVSSTKKNTSTTMRQSTPLSTSNCSTKVETDDADLLRDDKKMTTTNSEAIHKEMD